MKKSPIFVSLIPNLMGGEGHIIPYHNSIKRAIEILGWHHQVIYSPEENLPSLPENWQGCLKGNQLENDQNLLIKLKEVFIFAQTIRKYFKPKLNNTKEEETYIIFIERFIHLQLISLWLSLLFLPRKNLYIWILYRHNYHQYKTNFVYKIFNKLLKNLVKSGHFCLFSDSELLAESMTKYFEESLTVMPIPHTTFIERSQINYDNNICWWAGSPREEKGWNIIKKLTECETNLGEKFTLVASKSADLINVNGGVKVVLTDDNLSREDYEFWLSKTDIMLIPYDSIAYKERTSGVFTESIMAGNIPVTTKQTWMARELSKYDLEELIIEWDNTEKVWEKINIIVHCEQIKRKLKIMQKAYRDFHNINNFAHQFKISFHD